MSSTQKGGDLHPYVTGLIDLTGANPKQVLSLAKAIDEALDSAQGYGTSVVETSLTSPIKYGEIANLSSAAFALAAMVGEYSRWSLADAIHKGWSFSIIHCGNFRTPEVRAAKMPLALTDYNDLPASEKSKDDVAVEAVIIWASQQ